GGPFRSREDLRRVRGLGPKTFEQAAGFLRVQGDEPLDRTAVHPESYALAHRIARELGLDLASSAFARGELAPALEGVDPARFAGTDAGIETVRDILSELARPGRDPRGKPLGFEYQEGVEKLSDVKVGMELPGTVTNVTDFGAFVDIGVHRDGLVHVSQLSERRIAHPSEVVAVGDRVRVRVIEIDLDRERIGLSLRKT
ncbi:S1 RNA-binding domain-containing protein, partial [bacterium]|nr:S1 RNA-binding domain-containing protein [bacterium]